MHPKNLAVQAAFCLLASIPLSAQETVARPLSEKEARKRQEKLRNELESPISKWLSEDVAYIISDEERTALKRLSTADEFEQFVEQFWVRRDPTPDTEENEFKEEHYRRIAYANERFASGIPGWKTDRGRIYIAYGPPDEIEAHPSGGSYQRPIEEGGGTTSVYPFEKWRYRWIETVDTDVVLEFVDKTMTGEYRLTMDPSEKDALMMVPGAGLTLYEQMGLFPKSDRFSRTDGTRLGTGNQPLSARRNQFERLRQITALYKAPIVKFKDLEAMVSSSIRYNLLPIEARADYMRLTGSTVLTSVTAKLEKRDLQFRDVSGVSRATVHIHGRITSLSRRVVTTFEDTVTVEVPTEMLAQTVNGASLYQKSVPLAPGTYRLNLAVKDVVGGNATNHEMALVVPRLDDETLAMSSLILADLIEAVPARNIGAGRFVIGPAKVRPRPGETFHRHEKLGVYSQIYNLSPGDKTQANGRVDYEVVQEGSGRKVLAFSEPAAPAASRPHVIERMIPLGGFAPGAYRLNLKVTDLATGAVLTPSASFRVLP